MPAHTSWSHNAAAVPAPLAKPSASAEQENTKAYTQVFHRMDRNRTGSINSLELYHFLQDVGYQTTLPLVEAMVEVPDADHSGTVSLQEFLHLVAKRVPAQKRDYE